jgi:tetratricopeptide (TPR) repeat protein
MNLGKVLPTSTPGRRAAPSAKQCPRKLAIGIPVAVFLITCVAFWPATGNGFVSLDDTTNFHQNYHYRGLGLENIRWAFTTVHFGAYQPLSWILFGAQYVLWELSPAGYHTVSVLVHAMNAVLLYFVAARLLGLAMPVAAGNSAVGLRYSAALAALLFAVHPLRVEAVAWVSCQPYVWVGFFYLLSILAYLRACREGASRRQWASWLTAAWLCYGGSLLSKGPGVGLAGVLLILDVYPLRRLRGGRSDRRGGVAAWVVLAEKLPFLVLACGSVLMSMRSKSEALVPTGSYDLPHRAVLAVWGAVSYLHKTLLPMGLSPWCQFPDGFSIWQPRLVVSALMFLGLTVAATALARRWLPAPIVWVYYLVVLAPVSHLARLSNQASADRYTYLSCMGWAVLGGAGLLAAWTARASGRIRRSAFDWIAGGAGAGCLVLAVLTWQQIAIWGDNVRLWTRAIEVTPEIPMPYNNLGAVLRMRKEPAAALGPLRCAVELDPNLTIARTNLALAFLDLGQYDQAVEQCRAAAKTTPHQADVYAVWGTVLAGRGDANDAIERFRESLAIDPNTSLARLGLARVLSSQGQHGRAADLLRAGANLHDSDPRVLAALARQLLDSPDTHVRNPGEALVWAEKASRLAHDDNIEFLELVVTALAANGQYERVIAVGSDAIAKAQRRNQYEAVKRLSRQVEDCRRRPGRAMGVNTPGDGLYAISAPPS